MIKFIRERIALKVTIYVNLLILVVLIAGSVLITFRQNTKLEAMLP